MPMQSQAQRGAMFAAAAGKSNIGIPKKVGAKFVKHDEGGKLPAHVEEMHKAHGGCAHRDHHEACSHGGMCAHGGHIDVHHPECPEEKREGAEPESHGQEDFLAALRKSRNT